MRVRLEVAEGCGFGMAAGNSKTGSKKKSGTAGTEKKKQVKKASTAATQQKEKEYRRQEQLEFRERNRFDKLVARYRCNSPFGQRKCSS